jgi:hypothetical protein
MARGWGTIRALMAAALVLALASGAALAQGFDPDRLSAGDREELQTILEFAQTNRERRLPESGATVTVVRTETRPRICRYFVIEGGGLGRQDGVGCREGARQWDLGGTAAPVPPEPTEPIMARPAPEREEDDRSPPPQVLAPAPAADVAAPEPAPPADTTTAARPDFPLPDRPPGTGIPLAAAPQDVRGFPAPPAVPAGHGATPDPEDDAGGAAGLADALAERPAEGAEDTAAPSDAGAPAGEAAEAPDLPLPEGRPAVPDEPAAHGEDDGAATDITAEEAGRLARLDTPPDIPQPPEPPARTSDEADAVNREVAERPFAPPAEEAEPAEETETAAPAASDTDSSAASDAASEEERAGAGGGSELQLVNGEGVATLPLPRRRPDEAGADRPEAPLPGERPAPPG